MRKKLVTLMMTGLIGISVVACGNNENIQSEKTNIENESVDAEATPEEIQEGAPESVESVDVVETDPTDDNASYEHKSALKKAYAYSELMHMSKAELYNQLTSEHGEKFSAEAAQYAIDTMDVDWNANALEKAKYYSELMHMSKAGIYDHLTSEYGERFTADEAQYAIDNIEADWNANALETAKSYQEMDMSPEAIRDHLSSEYGEKFTQEEADYAVDNLE